MESIAIPNNSLTYDYSYWFGSCGIHSQTRNIGTFDSPLRVENEIAAEIQVPMIIKICKNFNVFKLLSAKSMKLFTSVIDKSANAQ